MENLEKGSMEEMQRVYTPELVQNLLNAYQNMERMGMISHRRFLRYRRNLKKLTGKTSKK